MSGYVVAVLVFAGLCLSPLVWLYTVTTLNFRRASKRDEQRRELAAEREKTRAPFLALADKLDQDALEDPDNGSKEVGHIIARSIRNVADGVSIKELTLLTEEDLMWLRANGWKP